MAVSMKYTSTILYRTSFSLIHMHTPSRFWRQNVVFLLTLLYHSVIRRLVILIQTQATLRAERDAAIAQAKGASAAAQTLIDSGDSKKANTDNRDNEILEEKENEIHALEKEINALREELTKVKKNEEAVKKQAASVSKEYDRLMKEHEMLQKQVDSDSRKDKWITLTFLSKHGENSVPKVYPLCDISSSLETLNPRL